MCSYRVAESLFLFNKTAEKQNKLNIKLEKKEGISSVNINSIVKFNPPHHSMRL